MKVEAAGAPSGHAGVPGETNPPCTSCDTVTLNSCNGSVALAFDGGNVYPPDQAQVYLSIAQ